MNAMDVVFAGNRLFQSGSYSDDKKQAIYSILKRCAFCKSVNGMLHRSMSTYLSIYKAFFWPGFTLHLYINQYHWFLSLWRCLSQSWHLLHHPYPLALRWWVNQDQVIRLNKLYARTTKMHLRVFAWGDNPKYTFNNNTNKMCFSSKKIMIKLTRIENSNCEFFLDKIKH